MGKMKKNNRKERSAKEDERKGGEVGTDEK